MSMWVCDTIGVVCRLVVLDGITVEWVNLVLSKAIEVVDVVKVISVVYSQLPR